MRVVVTVATGNVGPSLIRALAAHDDLVPLFRGADCVVHPARSVQPSHDLRAPRRLESARP